MTIKKLLFHLCLLFNVAQLTAQFKTPQVSIETGTVVSHGDHSPFWFSAKDYGYISEKPASAWIRPVIKTEIDWNKRFDYSYGIDVWARYDQDGKLFLQQGWVKTKVLFVTAYAGRMEEILGNQDSTLSGGGLLWSENAPPMPKIAIQVEHWTPIPFTWKYLDFKGGLSHGWFGDQPYVKGSFMHHKYAYIRLGGKLPVHISYGFNHYAQWGGTSETRGKFPDDFKAYKDIFIAQQSDLQFLPDGTPISNTLGNHIGNRNFGLDVDVKNYHISSYWQTIFEDGSGKAWRNIKDGLWGISLKKSKKAIISGVLYEFLHTTDQSGRYNWNPFTMREYGGNDNYFNHGHYNFGWTYNGYTIGTPFITSPVYNSDNSISIANNRVIAHHIGMEGSKGIVNYRLLYTYSLNFGTNSSPFEPAIPQHSILISSRFSEVLPYHVDFEVNLGIDRGTLYGNNTGAEIKLKKSF